MLKKSLVLATVAAALAGPVLAETVSQGAAMQAKILGVAPGAYSIAELSLLDTARKEGDSVTEQAILNKSIRSGFDSPYAVDASTLSSNDN